MALPKVTVITVICGSNVEFMSKCLDSLIVNTNYPNVEFVVVTDSDNDMMKNYISSIAEYNASIKSVYRNKRHCNSSNRNLGALHASSDSKYYLFADSDVMYSNNQWLTNLVHILEEHDDIGIIGGGEGTSLGHFCWIDDVTGLLINDVMDFSGVIPNHPVEMMIIPGYSMLMRKDMFDDVCGWDEGFIPVYGEDIDICLRCILSGYKVFGLFNKGVQHLYRNTKENNSSELIGSDSNQLWLTVASNRRLALKYNGILPSNRCSSYSEWITHLKQMLKYGREHLINPKNLPPTATNGKLNHLYLPLKDTAEIAKIYNNLFLDY